jgi:ABC-type sugar transport system substrate-binding protein
VLVKMNVGRSSSRLGALAGIAAAGLVAGCGSSSSNGASGPSSGSGGSGSKEVVYFSPASKFPYILAQHKGLQAGFDRLGYKIKFVSNDGADPAQLSTQIQQFLASGEKPAAIILFGLDPKAGVSQAAQLSRLAPTFGINYEPPRAAFKYLKAYVGLDNTEVGRASGRSILELRKKLAAEHKLHNPKGNVLYISGIPGSPTAVMRKQGWDEATKSAPFNVLQYIEAGADADSAYKVAAQLIPKYKSKLDIIMTESNLTASGIIRALKQNGLTPGKDVWIVSGNCGGPKSVTTSNQQYSTGAALATVEGSALAQAVVQYLVTKKVTPGNAVVKYTPEPPPFTKTPPIQHQTLPSPSMIGPDSVNQKAWGFTYAEGCPLT